MSRNRRGKRGRRTNAAGFMVQPVEHTAIATDARGWLQLGCCVNFQLKKFDSREAVTKCPTHGERVLKLPPARAI